MTCAPYSWFEKWVNLEREKRNDDEEYESVKNAIGQKLIDQVLHLYPNIKVILLMYKVLPNSTRNWNWIDVFIKIIWQDAIDYVYVSTPINHENYLNAHKGAGFGLDQIKQRFDPIHMSLLRTESGIKGNTKYNIIISPVLRAKQQSLLALYFTWFCAKPLNGLQDSCSDPITKKGQKESLRLQNRP